MKGNSATMSEHRVNLTWQRNGTDFEYQAYSRNHSWKFQNGLEIEASATTQFLGDASKIDPEEAFTASLSSCHMLTFLAICAHKGLIVDGYEDHAIGYLEKNQDRKLVITRVDLHPRVTFGENIIVGVEELVSLHDRSHHECFIANSVKTEVRTIIEQ